MYLIALDYSMWRIILFKQRFSIIYHTGKPLILEWNESSCSQLSITDFMEILSVFCATRDLKPQVKRISPRDSKYRYWITLHTNFKPTWYSNCYRIILQILHNKRVHSIPPSLYIFQIYILLKHWLNAFHSVLEELSTFENYGWTSHI